MATVEIDLNCMCLFVPRPTEGTEKGSVHVLMPCTGHASGHEKHVALMFFNGADGKRRTESLAGWELVLGRKPGSARTSLHPTEPGTAGAQIVDLTALTSDEEGKNGYHVPRHLVEGSDGAVVSRISFYGGGLAAIEVDDESWQLQGKSYALAHKATWRIRVSSTALRWNDLLGRVGASPPLSSLDAVAPELDGAEQVYRLHVHHVSEKAFRRVGDDFTSWQLLPLVKFDPNVLNPNEIKEHFRMFYALLGDPDPRPGLLPQLPKMDGEGGGIGGWACKTAQAKLAQE